MGHVTNGTHSSQMEIPDGNFPVFFCNWKTPMVTIMILQKLLTSIAYASENLKTFADLSRCSDRRSSLVYIKLCSDLVLLKKIPWLTYAHNLCV